MGNAKRAARAAHVRGKYVNFSAHVRDTLLLRHRFPWEFPETVFFERTNFRNTRISYVFLPRVTFRHNWYEGGRRPQSGSDQLASWSHKGPLSVCQSCSAALRGP